MGNETHLAAVDAAEVVDHVEIGRFGLSDRGKFSQRPRVGHEIADADFRVVCRLIVTLQRHRT